jgi:hypothetical protein
MSNHAKKPPRYYQKRREAKRAEHIALCRRLGEGYIISRHEDDPEGSQRWVETGRWEATDE